MDNESYLEKSILEKVKIAKEKKGYETNAKLCIAFNNSYKSDIDKGLVRSLNKDFLFRVFNGKQKYLLSNIRFAKICEFLNIEIDETHASYKISEAAYLVDKLIHEKPELEKQIFSVVQSITNLSKGVEV